MILKGDWLQHPGTQAVMAALSEGGQNAWFVGGCVRNSILDQRVDDIDITTDAVPKRVVALCETAGFKVVPTGLEHGTVTVIAESKPHEITTLRRDVSTDGRRADVRFTESVQEDASRRDFTVNALYAASDGRVSDPLGTGLDDLKARNIRFIGTPSDRIREDYLRSLRFFRFFAWYGDPENGLDAEGLAAVAAHLDGLERLSRERVGAEMKKLLAAPDPSMAVAAMEQSGVLTALLPGASARVLGVLTHLERPGPPNAMLRLATLGGTDVAEALRLSKKDATALDTLRTEATGTEAAGALGYRHGAEMAADILTLRAALLEQPLREADIAAAERGADQRFPIKASDLPQFQGKSLGVALKRLEAAWIASDFAMEKAALLRLADG